MRACVTARRGLRLAARSALDQNLLAGRTRAPAVTLPRRARLCAAATDRQDPLDAVVRFTNSPRGTVIIFLLGLAVRPVWMHFAAQQKAGALSASVISNVVAPMFVPVLLLAAFSSIMIMMLPVRRRRRKLFEGAAVTESRRHR